jgi:hypothetical protein
MELNDSEFDATFRKKVSDADPQFEDAAWDKMERKLKRRDRVVFFRKSALVLLVLLAGVWGYYSMDKMPSGTGTLVVTKKETPVVSDTVVVKQENNGYVPAISAAGSDTRVAGLVRDSRSTSGPGIKNFENKPVDAANSFFEKRLYGEVIASIKSNIPGIVADTLSIVAVPVKNIVVPGSAQVLPGKKGIKVKRNLPISLAISAGPEFNSASSVVGGDPGFSAGLTLGFGISRKLDLQAGVRYSLKKYNSGANVKYNFPGMNTYLKNTFTGLDASCNVLEIPVQASYNVIKKGINSVNLNAGLSSYLMLKEDYVLKYNSLYGQTNWDLQKRNANRHLLSIVDLSATYFVKVQHSNLKVGVEPFIKIPLTGVGEGNINLKSSGISLKLRYDLDKKNN